MSDPVSKASARAALLRRRLLKWYDASRRTLPWREHPSPYRTWISEIMLQQTQVSTVLPYFEKFMRRFPDIKALAKAPEERVLSAWAGLGYYSRARNLHRTAKTVVSELGGRVPDDIDGLKKLPGIGAYTAAAIASIAFNKPRELVDGNVVRVLTRLFALRGAAKHPKTIERVWGVARALMNGKGPASVCKRPGDFNQALMELGALVCIPDSPRCGSCPWKRDCAAFAQGLQESLPESGPERAPVRLDWRALWVERPGEILLWKRAADERFLPGHWGLPETRHLRRVKPGKSLQTVRHSITHHRIVLTVHEGAAPAQLPEQARWIRRRRLEELLVSSLWRKACPKKTKAT